MPASHPKEPVIAKVYPLCLFQDIVYMFAERKPTIKDHTQVLHLCRNTCQLPAQHQFLHIALEVRIDCARPAAKHNCHTFLEVQYKFPISEVPM